MNNEVEVLKALVANLVDRAVGSTRGWTESREVPMYAQQFDVSVDMARYLLEVCDEVRETGNYNPL